MQRKQGFAQEQNILILTRAGLTVLQAKIYLTLVFSGKQTVKTLAEIAKVDRSNAYREVLKLHGLGLVVKKIGVPNLYEALPIEYTISHLLTCKKEEYEQTKIDAEELLKKFNGSIYDSKKIIDEDFLLIPKKCGFRRTSLENIRKAHVSNDTISCLKRLSQALPDSYECQKFALENGVKTRMIIEKPQNRKSISSFLWKLMAYPNFELRYTTEPPKVLGACLDNKRLGILINPLADIWDSSVFTTSHQSFVTLFQNYFNTLWESAIPIEKEI